LEISLVTVCMNRQAHLLVSAAHAARWPHHGEHVIVDWSSAAPIRRRQLPDDPRIRLIRVEGESRWNPSRAYNFALAQARGRWLMRMDADCWPTERWVPALVRRHGAILVGAGGEGRYGQFLMTRPVLNAVGGFNEFMEGWGFEDKDLRARLAVQQHRPLTPLPLDWIGVIEHADAERVGRGHLPGGFERRRALAALRTSRLHNRLVAAHCPWGAATPRSRYEPLDRPAADGTPRWQLRNGTRPVLPPEIAGKLRQNRRRLFWSTLLAIPAVAVEQLPEKLLPADRSGHWPVRWWHRLYWHTLQRLVMAPVQLLSLSRGLRARLDRGATADPGGGDPP
jgi:hypothetical protein